jgi:hypothetical protein
MGVGVQTGGSAPPRAGALRQPAYGEYSEQPDIEAQDEGTEQVWADSRLVRLAQWPVLASLAVLEIAWLIVLAYAIHRFFLSPILG